MSLQSFANAFIAGLIVWASAGFAQDLQPADALPKLTTPSGPFGIGRVGYDWVDRSRPDRVSSDPDAHRELMVYFWYPATVKSAGTKGSYYPGARRMDTLPEVRALLADEFGSHWPEIVSEAIFSHAAEHAPVVKSPRRLPLIVFSHGLGGTGFEYTCLIEDLVSRGYVVASIEHTYLDSAVWFPDGRVAPRRKDTPPVGLSPGERYRWTMTRTTEAITEGAADVRFTLDRITAANANPQEFLLAGRLDLNRVAAMGHSAGAEFAVRACQLDARFRACVDLDGGMFPVAALPEYPDGRALQQPLLLLEPYYTESQMAGTPAERTAYFRKKEEQLQATRPGTYNVVLHAPGLLHPAFDDMPLLFAGHDGYPSTGIALHNHELIEKYVREFVGKNLMREKAPLLDSNKAVIPEATVKRYGR